MKGCLSLSVPPCLYMGVQIRAMTFHAIPFEQAPVLLYVPKSDRESLYSMRIE